MSKQEPTKENRMTTHAERAKEYRDRAIRLLGDDHQGERPNRTARAHVLATLSLAAAIEDQTDQQLFIAEHRT